ncbi:Chaoptin-like Protein [Tribolium castaneum]|uniref:Chaoptin-like Protein n=2 Tax=Tribolium castaneum TaxID=7070 RepID=D6WMZ1_TRICA|nr:PREDICTED: insulin-like growth factor-binding protein complex acid labile subunit isoform X1 [Tribolium castaneum]EFA03262.2 Chaoptin-like Protein [Tribolium castaneum]|eukprot:XP_015836042.1 PREDICTED: insulin-like growth factor-binding protein complex acid labile subunit isoform X1 [Tribolium castaneum]
MLRQVWRSHKYLWTELSVSCRMLWWLLLGLCSTSGVALCPSMCQCGVTSKGRRKVQCVEGGMTEAIPTHEMDAGTEVLEISAPAGDWNALSISPTFQRFKRLEEVHIRRSGLTQVGMHPFWGVPSLKLLDLTVNNISGVADHNFRGLVNLVELNLDDNRITSLQSGVFKHLTELRILTLQRNLLDELVPRLFLKLGKLHMLKLSGNKFDELNPEVFKDIPELRVLECRECGLRRINTQIYHLLPYLSHLDLGDNQMQFIASDEFRDLKRLHSLKLDGNQLPVVLEHTFVRQQELKYLCLARNRLAKITNTAFVNLSSLADLDIGYNKLDRLEMQALQPVADTLERLVISGNAFGPNVIRNILNTVYNVRELGVAHMNLRHIPKGFFPERVRKLNVSANNLTELESGSLPRQLLELDLSHNDLQRLSESLILKLEDLHAVSLGSNPWSCRVCDLSSIIFRLNRTNLFRNVTCAAPKPLQGREISALHLEDLPGCKPPSQDAAKTGRLGLVVGFASLVSFSLVCVTFAVCSCMRRRARDAVQEQKRLAELQENALDRPIAIFAKGEISFKFPLDLTERKVEVSTIDEIKKDTQSLPNGTGI